jgi:hypothetical protein
MSEASLFYDEMIGPYTYKGRVYEVVSKQGDHLWYEVSCRTYLQDKLMMESVFSDFLKGKYLYLSDQDLSRAIKRVRK